MPFTLEGLYTIESANIFNIVVSHYGPESIGLRNDSNGKIEEWNMQLQYILECLKG